MEALKHCVFLRNRKRMTACCTVCRHHTFCFTRTINQKTNEISKVLYVLHLIQLHVDGEFSRKLNGIEFYCFAFHSVFCVVLYYIWVSHWNWTWHPENGVIGIACNVSRFVFISTRILHFRGSIRFSVGVHARARVCVCGVVNWFLFFVFTIVFQFKSPYHEWQSCSVYECSTQNNRLGCGWWRIDSFVAKHSSHIACEWKVSHVCE